MNKIFFGENLKILCTLPSKSVDLIYIDPPFNTGEIQRRTKIKTIKEKNGDRVGFKGNSYKTIELGTKSYFDNFGNDYLYQFIRPRLVEAHRLLSDSGSLYFHIDYREVHYCKILLDEIFGRENFINEIIWAYDYGGKSKSRWPTKHDNILFYVKDNRSYTFNIDEINRIDYMAPGLVNDQKKYRGKIPTDTWWYSYVGPKLDKKHLFLSLINEKRLTDTWWHTIVGTNSKEKTGYPTQKPRGLIDRIIKSSSLENQVVMDFFAGSGTVGESCLENGRNFILIDNNEEALMVMANRFHLYKEIEWINFDPKPYIINIEKTISNGKGDFEIEENKIKFSDDFILLINSSIVFQKELEKKSDFWKGSPFEWINELAASRKGKLGRHLIKTYFESEGFNIRKAENRDANFIFNNKSIATKFSTIWGEGKYYFQQIRDREYDYLVCLGISPFAAHCWIFEKDYVIQNATIQHKSGSEYWISINPNNLENWVRGYGGSLLDASKVLSNLLRKDG